MQVSMHPRQRLLRDLIERLIIPLSLLVGAFLFGTLGYTIIGWGEWSLLNSAYMTSITLTTVGYGEVLGQMDERGKIFTMILMWSGMGVTLYSVSTLTAFVVERHLGRYFRERKMEKRIAQLSEHVIICGAGNTGRHIIQEFVATGRDCCVVDISSEQVKLLNEHYPQLAVLEGDATEEDTLKRAGIEKANGIIANLHEDSRNLLITVTARFTCPNIKIVARVQDQKLTEKFMHAGADYIVNPAFIGGLRMASEMLRPHVVTFLDKMLRKTESAVRMEEGVITGDSRLVGKNLGELALREQTGLQPIAIKPPQASDYLYNPGPECVLEAGTVIVVIGTPEQISSLREICCR